KRQQPGTLARAEAVAKLLEVARQEAGRVAVAFARLVGEPLGLGAGMPYRSDERALQLGEAGRRVLGRGPDGEDHRQAGALEPKATEVMVRGRVLERRLQCRVADQERRLGLFPQRNV